MIDKNTLSPHQGLVVEINLSESLPSPLSSLWCWIWNLRNFVEYVKIFLVANDQGNIFGAWHLKIIGLTRFERFICVWPLGSVFFATTPLTLEESRDTLRLPSNHHLTSSSWKRKACPEKPCFFHNTITDFSLSTRKTEKIHTYALFWLN